jgi:beta-lactamase class A
MEHGSEKPRFSWKKYFQTGKVWRWLLLATLIGVVWFVGYRQGRTVPRARSLPLRTGGYHFVNPLLVCGMGEPDTSSVFDELHDQLTALIDREKASHNLTRMSIVVRDLSSSRWIGINENDLYAPASLLKVAVMMTYFAEAQENPEFLQQRYTFNDDSSPDDSEYFRSAVSLQSGQSYTVQELLTDLIVHSSNSANVVLRAHEDEKRLSDLFSLLNIAKPPAAQLGDFMSPKDYSQFFRVLYNGTYLSPSYSEKALAMLAGVEFRDGLVKGVPQDVVVAHKFGERGLAASSANGVDRRELHDCGIVYAPNHPYLACIMTEGTSFTELANSIADASAIIYQQIKTLPASP